MAIPENENRSFAPLAEEFNKSASSFAKGEGNITLDAVMTKYTILQKFKAETPSDRMALAESLLDGALEILRRAALPSNRENLSTPVSNVQTILTRLTAADELPNVPERASRQLADAALDLVRKSEKLPSYDYNWSDCQNHKTTLLKLAQSLVGFAETLQNKDNAAGFAASKSIAPAKRPVLQVGQSAS